MSEWPHEFCGSTVQQGGTDLFEIPSYVRGTVILLASVETLLLHNLKVCWSEAHTVLSTTRTLLHCVAVAISSLSINC
jgi:hypothetical protein